MDYLESLNENQQGAVLQTEGPVMIIAGAGSGKTRVLTYRLAHLIQKGIDPFNILSLTFTNRAAKEMQHRIQSLVGGEAKNIWMGTFHSVFSRILRSEAEKIGYPSNFTIYDSDDSKSLIKTILNEVQLDDKTYKPSVVHNRISAAKNRLISAEAYLKNAHYMADDAAAGKPEMGRLFKLYSDRCKKAGAMDFDDLLFNTFKLFNEHIDVLNKYQNRFKYVMVDEFQDTNIAQYMITRKLAAQNRNICVVGDDAQSIYAFRGADIQNILNFEKDYPELKVFKLEQNYRSTQTIVEAANSIISKNKAQLPKNVWTANDQGNYIDLIHAGSDNEEGKLIANAIFEAKMQHQLKHSDFAILYRTNSQSRAFEESLRSLNLPYKIVGGISFYQRKEIKDLLAYFRLMMNPNDEQSLRRIINYPKRGIGDTTLGKLFITADEQGASIWDVLSHAESVIPGKTAQIVKDFVVMLEAGKVIANNQDAYEAASDMAKKSGLLRELYDDKTVEGIARYENVQQLLNGIKAFVDDPEKEDKSLGAFLQEVSLLTDADSKAEDKDSITMMTIHSAKGLEFKYVYVVGMEEDLFPSAMMMNSRADLEEERRLFYVAVTRAEIHLTLSHANTRYRFGKLIDCKRSRFVEEISPIYLKPVATKASFFNKPAQTAPKEPFTRTAVKNLAPPAAKTKIKYIAPTDFKASDTSGLASGMKVEHPKFGFGMVKLIDSNGSDRKAVIDFEELGEKTLILSFAKLRIH
ncbi:MAG: uvrD [Cytophagaceae bacterium]|jgi:DNA helicase-2/ATP-dependent DNA helicase PcrA|nr:uvrD [Cytophagaceae bacterium]